jgi:hypothetical protein
MHFLQAHIVNNMEIGTCGRCYRCARIASGDLEIIVPSIATGTACRFLPMLTAIRASFTESPDLRDLLGFPDRVHSVACYA